MIRLAILLEKSFSLLLSIQGIGGICFGLLEYVNNTNAFIGLSYFLRFPNLLLRHFIKKTMQNKCDFKIFRFVEGAANAACNSTVSGILIHMFPTKYVNNLSKR